MSSTGSTSRCDTPASWWAIDWGLIAMSGSTVPTTAHIGLNAFPITVPSIMRPDKTAMVSRDWDETGLP